MPNWIAGYWFAGEFGLQFAHTPFSSKQWENFLGLGLNEASVKDLVGKGYKKVGLPLFDEYNPMEVDLVKSIIATYNNRRVVFVAEQDQFYRDQFGVIDDLKKKFYNAPARKSDQLIYSNNHFNIAIHIRRGDIVVSPGNQNLNLLMRWQDNQYFEKVLTQVVENIKTDKPIAIYLFSQGDRKDFPEFLKFSNLNFCLDMSAQNSFLHMVYADLLITSKSSFSYKPALLNKSVKVCPKNFWHGYPDSKEWILVENDGSFDIKRLKEIK